MNTYYGKGFTRMATEEEVLASLPVPVCMPEAGDPLPVQFTNWVPQQYQIWCGRPGGLLKSGWSSVVLGDRKSWVQKLARHGGSGIVHNNKEQSRAGTTAPAPAFQS